MRGWNWLPGILAALLVVCLPASRATVAAQSAAGATMTGTVTDSTGAPVREARVEFRSSAGMVWTTTGDDGAFRLQANAEAGTLQVSYPGLGTATVEVRPRMDVAHLQIVMAPASTLQRIEVKAGTEDRIPDQPGSEYQLTATAIANSGSLVIDDALRQAPGFSTFRRSSSLFANPSSQGVSLRGIGASATSRTAVVLDGVPLNDPFGGWVYWARVPRDAIASMEVSNGGASDLYGGGALGGVVNIRRKQAPPAYAGMDLSYGSMNTPDVSFSGGAPLGKWTISGDVQALKTDGYILVPPDQRGSQDTKANTQDLAGSVDVAHTLGEQGSVFVRGGGFGENRNNGTELQVNSTTLESLETGLDWGTSRAGMFSARVYGSSEKFHQTFSSVSPDQNTEALTGVQQNPSQQIGFVGTWRKLLKEKHQFTAGLEARGVRGHSAETNYAAGIATAYVDAGGRQHSIGFFAQDAWLLAPNWVLTMGARVDVWNNNTGYQERTPLNGGPATAATFPERTESAFSPRVTLLRNFSNGLALSASVYQAFRAPYLNELYRNFRQGNTFTLANPALTAEHLTGGEAGFSWATWEKRLTMRGDFFWSDIADPVANVTIDNTGPVIVRQKENLGLSQAQGFELGGEYHWNEHVQFSAAYLFVNSIVKSYAANPSIVGNVLPQVPQNQFSVQASYVSRKWMAGVQARFLGNQFDDDRNTLPLGRAFSLDAQISRELGWNTSVYFAVQNLTNDRFWIARTPVVNEGPPTFVRGGFRFSWR